MKSLAIVKNPRLTSAQKELYRLVCEKIQSNTKLVFEEARIIYIGWVNRNVRNGIPYRYNYWANPHQIDGKWYYDCKLVPMTEEEISWTTLEWLTKNLGCLILKGYLQVLPMVDLSTVTTNSGFNFKKVAHPTTV